VKRLAILAFSGPAVCIGTVGLSFETRIEIGLRILALILGIIAALISLVAMIRINRVKFVAARHRLCQACKEGGSFVEECPIPWGLRPPDCPVDVRNRKKRRKYEKKKLPDIGSSHSVPDRMLDTEKEPAPTPKPRSTD
jgi:hypothetical protein